MDPLNLQVAIGFHRNPGKTPSKSNRPLSKDVCMTLCDLIIFFTKNLDQHMPIMLKMFE